LDPVTGLNRALILRFRPAAQRQAFVPFHGGCNGPGSAQLQAVTATVLYHVLTVQV